MEMYNVTIELDVAADEMIDDDGNLADAFDQTLTDLADYHTVLTRSMFGNAELIMSLPAEDPWQATTTVRALVSTLPATRRVVIETSADFDRRADVELYPLLSVTEAAEKLGVTRQAVLQRIDAGSLPAVKIGSTWAVPVASVVPA